MPTVEKISIEGFKSIGKSEAELRPVNALIGANGSGKSNFTGAFAFLNAIRAECGHFRGWPEHLEGLASQERNI